MVAVLVTAHIIASMLLILLVLLHAGRGGGLSEMFGGGSGGGLSGSSGAERNLDRLTVTIALFFTATTLSLVFALQ